LKYLQYHHIAPGDPPFGQCELPQRKKHKRHGHCSKRKKERRRRRQGLGGLVVVVHYRRSSLVFFLVSLYFLIIECAFYIYLFFLFPMQSGLWVSIYVCIEEEKEEEMSSTAKDPPWS